jgi:GT2 family glycosyltransferase
MNLPSVYIAVLNWYNYPSTVACVRSLLAMDYPNFKIVIVDNFSKNESVEVFRKEFPDLQVIALKENIGYAGGNKVVSDLALKENADLVWVLNNDTTVRQNALSELIRSYQQFGEAVYSNLTLMSESPDVVHYSGSYLPDEISDPGNPYDKNKGLLLTDIFDQLDDKEARIYGHSLLIPTTIIRKCGFMDPDFFMFCEETDYFKTLEKFNIKTRFVKKAIILHESSGSFKKEGNLDNKLKLPLLYYAKRNQYYFDMKWKQLKRSEILKQRGGWLNLMKFFVKYRTISKEEKERLGEDYMFNLAAWDAFRGKRGKTLDPADFR